VITGLVSKIVHTDPRYRGGAILLFLKKIVKN